MISGLLGIKQTQTRQFTADGKQIPVTRITVGPCWVLRHIDGGHYKSVQMGFSTNKNLSKSVSGQAKKAGLQQKPRFLREFRLTDTSDLDKLLPGTKINASDVLAVGDKVMVTGISKGKGFAGVVRRHGFAGGPRTHGQSDRERAPGSLGQTTTPGRVYRGKRMAGRAGGAQATVKGLEVVAVDPNSETILVKGVVPGKSGGFLTISKEN